MAERDVVSAAGPTRFSLTEAADKLGLPCAQLRRYAETYREFLGMQRSADGQWEFSAAHLRFIQVLAAGGTAAEAADALRGYRRPISVNGSPDVPSPPLHAATAKHGAHGDAVDEKAVSRAQPEEADAASPPAADHLLQRVDDLALHVEDLAEETKQIQILLSRVIALLDDGGRRRPGEVYTWEPVELTPAPGIVHALIPPQPPHPHYPSAGD